MGKTRIYDFLMGLSMGVAAGMLLAPNEGKKMRDRLAQAANDGASHAKDYGDTVGQAVLSFLDKSRHEVERQREGFAQAIRQGSHAYKQAIN
jgi:gas vesicle protein